MDGADGEGGERWAVVTGASRGLGLEMARLLAADGHALVLVARSGGRLREVARELSDAHGVRAEVEALDLADPDGPAALFDALEARGVRPEVLVNNAGFGDYGPLHEADLETSLQMVRLNVTALTHLTRLALPPMVEARRGRILNVASTAAFQPGPLMAVYYATKAYVLSFSEGVAEEVAPHGVTVTCLCPGPTETGFQDRADMHESGLLRLGLMDPAVVARKGYRALLSGRRVVVPGLLNKLLAWSVRFTPRILVAKTVRQLQAPRS